MDSFCKKHKKYGFTFFKERFFTGQNRNGPQFELPPTLWLSRVSVIRRSQITLSTQKGLKRHLHASTVSEAISQPRSTPMHNEAAENCYLKNGVDTKYFYIHADKWYLLNYNDLQCSNKTERNKWKLYVLCITCAALCLSTFKAPIKTACHFFFSKEMHQDFADRWCKAVQTLCCVLYLVILNRLQTDNYNVPICFWWLESWTDTPLGSFLLLYFLLFFSSSCLALWLLLPSALGLMHFKVKNTVLCQSSMTLDPPSLPRDGSKASHERLTTSSEEHEESTEKSDWNTEERRCNGWGQS